MARGAAGERLAQLEAAIAQLGARLRRLEESSSARASALEQRLGRLEHSLLARVRHAHDALPHANAGRARSLESILIANGISPKETFSKANSASPENETKKYSGFVDVERTPSPTIASSRSWELVRTARRGDAPEVQRRLDVVAPVGRTSALRDGALSLRDLHTNRSGRGDRSPLHTAARWGRADVGVAQLLLLERHRAGAALDENASKPLRLAESNATAHAVAAYW